MSNPVYQTYVNDPAVRAEVERAARSARAFAVQRHLFMPVARLCGRLTAIRGVRLQIDPRVA